MTTSKQPSLAYPDGDRQTTFFFFLLLLFLLPTDENKQTTFFSLRMGTGKQPFFWPTDEDNQNQTPFCFWPMDDDKQTTFFSLWMRTSKQFFFFFFFFFLPTYEDKQTNFLAYG